MEKSTHKAEVVVVKLLPCPNADSISIVNVFDGYPCVVRTSDWKDGDLAVYITPDSLVNTSRPEFSFLKKENKEWERITIRKFRGNISLGLLIPAPQGSKEGDDVAEQLDIQHYEPPLIHIKRNGNMSLTGSMISFPNDIYAPVYDVDTLRRYRHVFEQNEPIFVTEKIHGCIKYNTPITMEEGNTLPIQYIVENDLVGHYVLGMNEEGKIIPSKILNVFINGETKFWMKIQSTVDKYNFSVIDCTQNHMFWLPKKNQYVKAEDLEIGDVIKSLKNIEQKITSISFYEKNQLKYDIETETHNYFADNILVHNSSARYVYHDNMMYVGSHRTWKRTDEDNVWAMILKKYPELEEFCRQNPKTVVYGEVYGWIQNLRYGLPPNTVNFSCFDILKDGKWMNSLEAREFGKNLPWVPHLSHITHFDFDMLLEEIEKDSVVESAGKNHIREGVVVKPLEERIHPSVGRVNLKLVSNRYLSLK